MTRRRPPKWSWERHVMAVVRCETCTRKVALVVLHHSGEHRELSFMTPGPIVQEGDHRLSYTIECPNCGPRLIRGDDVDAIPLSETGGRRVIPARSTAIQ